MRRRLVSIWQALVPPRVPVLAPFEPQPFEGTQRWFLGDLDQLAPIPGARLPEPTRLVRLARNPVVAGGSVALLGLVVALLLGLGRGGALPPALIDPGPGAPPPASAPAPTRVAAALSPSVEALFRSGKGKSKKSATKARPMRKRKATARRKSDIGPL
jgi:hypothetical protein